VRVRQGSCRLDIDLEGELTFAADERSIVRVPPGGRLRILERRGGHERELVAKAGPGGAPQIGFDLDGDPHPYDAAAQEWLARLLPDIFRQTGLDAAARVRRIHGRGGFEAVLAETRLIRSDYVQRTYLEELLRLVRPTPEQTSRALEVASQGIESDYDMAELLIAALGVQPGGVATASSFPVACASIESDYDQRRVLVELVSKVADPAAVGRALGCARGIDSDYDSAELLISVVARWPKGKELPDQFYTVARNVGSDYDRRRTLEAVTQRRPLPEADLRRVLATADAFRSDYDLAELLVSAAGAGRLGGDLAAAYTRAAAHIGSSYDRQRALAAMEREGG
jgi:hypothetical protein